MEYICRQCGCKKAYALPKNNRFGVYCAECNAWITWTTYNGMRELMGELDENDLNDNLSPRYIKKYGQIITMKCKKCGCLLYDSSHPKSDGQFNLVNASYCPNCGRKLI